jgi:hypothetical protein
MLDEGDTEAFYPAPPGWIEQWVKLGERYQTMFMKDFEGPAQVIVFLDFMLDKIQKEFGVKFAGFVDVEPPTIQ